MANKKVAARSSAMANKKASARPAKKAAKKHTKKVAATSSGTKKIAKKPPVKKQAKKITIKKAIKKAASEAPGIKAGKLTKKTERETFLSKPETALSGEEIVRLAIEQNADDLRKVYNNIASISDSLEDNEDVIFIYVFDSDTDHFPTELNAKLPDGTVKKVPVKIVPDMGAAIPHIGQATDELSDTNSPNYMGSICCQVISTSDPDFRGIVTSGHIFTHGEFYNYGGVLAPDQKRKTLISNQKTGEIFFQQMKSTQDLAIVEITDQTGLMNNYMSFGGSCHVLSKADIQSPEPNVTIISRNNKKRDAYIVDYNVSFEVSYFNMKKEIRNIILVGSTNNKASSITVSEGGDSGSCVYHKQTGQLIGMLLGGNEKFSFVLPLEETLQAYNYKIV